MAESKQLLHLVFGGELNSTGEVEFKDLSKLDLVGMYPNYAEARRAWSAKAYGTVDQAQMRYFVVHIHRPMDPDKDEHSQPFDLAGLAGPRGPCPAMLFGPGMAVPHTSPNAVVAVPARELGAGVIVIRLLRDYVSGQWGLLAVAILSMLFAAAMGGAIPWLLNQIVKYIFLRHASAMLAPLSLAVLGLMLARAAGQFFGRATVVSLCEMTVSAAQADMF